MRGPLGAAGAWGHCAPRRSSGLVVRPPNFTVRRMARFDAVP
jgi:hypothetical protein